MSASQGARAAGMFCVFLLLSCTAAGQEADSLQPEGTKCAWLATQTTEPAKNVEIDGRPAAKLPCSFHAAQQVDQQRWQREFQIDLSSPGHAGIGLDVYCPQGQALQPFDIILSDGKKEAVYPVSRKQLATGWNIIQVRKGQLGDQAQKMDLAAIRNVALVAHKVEAANLNLYVADLRVLDNDPISALERPAGCDRITKKDGQAIDGTILTDTYSINTPFGQFSLPAENVVGLESIGKGSVRLVLSNRQISVSAGSKVTEVNARDVAQLAYRVCANKPQQCEPTAAMLVVDNSRLAFAVDKLPLTLKTAHGSIDLPLGEMVCIERDANAKGSSSQFCACLGRGSELTGSLEGDKLDVKLTSGNHCSIEFKQLKSITWPRRAHESSAAAVVNLRDGRKLVGRMTSPSVSVKTSFGAEDIKWSNVQSLSTGRVDAAQVTMKVWGRDQVEGRLEDTTIAFELAEGPALKIQAAAISSISLPQAAAEVAQGLQ